MTKRTKITAKDIIRFLLIIIAGIAIAGIFTAAVLGLCHKLPSISASAAHEKEIESVLILNGDKSIRLCSLECHVHIQTGNRRYRYVCERDIL